MNIKSPSYKDGLLLFVRFLQVAVAARVEGIAQAVAH